MKKKNGATTPSDTEQSQSNVPSVSEGGSSGLTATPSALQNTPTETYGVKPGSTFDPFAKAPTEVKGQTALKPVSTSSGATPTAAKSTNKADGESATLDDIGNSFLRGSSRLGSMLAKTPAFIYDIAAYPQNKIAELTGLDVSTSSGEFANTLGLPENEVAKYYDDAVAKSQEQLNKKYDKGITEYFSKGEYDSAFGLLANSIAESAPISISLAMGNAAGLTTAQSIVGGGVVFAADKKSELDKENHDMSESSKMENAMANGLMEGVFENMGITKLGGMTKDIILKEGAEAGKEIVKEGFKKTYLPILKKYLGTSAEESLSEAATQYAQNAIDKYSGAKPDLDLMSGVVDAAIVGLGSGVSMSTIPTAMEVSKTKNGFSKALEIQQKKKALEDDLASENVPAESKTIISEKIKDLTSEDADLASEEKNKYAELSDTQQSLVDELVSKKNKIIANISDPSISEQTKSVFEKDIESIDSEIEKEYSAPKRKEEELKSEEDFFSRIKEQHEKDKAKKVEIPAEENKMQKEGLFEVDDSQKSQPIELSTQPENVIATPGEIVEEPKVDEKSTEDKIAEINKAIKENKQNFFNEKIDNNTYWKNQDALEKDLANLENPAAKKTETLTPEEVIAKETPTTEGVKPLEPEVKTEDKVKKLYTGRKSKIDDFEKTRGEHLFFSSDKDVSTWYAGDEENVTEANVDTSDFVDLTSQYKKTKFVKDNFTDEDIKELYKDELKFERERDALGVKSEKDLIKKYRERAEEDRFSGGKTQTFLLNKIKGSGQSGVILEDTFHGKKDTSYVVLDKSKAKTTTPKKEAPSPKTATQVSAEQNMIEEEDALEDEIPSSIKNAKTEEAKAQAETIRKSTSTKMTLDKEAFKLINEETYKGKSKAELKDLVEKKYIGTLERAYKNKVDGIISSPEYTKYRNELNDIVTGKLSEYSDKKVKGGGQEGESLRKGELKAQVSALGEKVKEKLLGQGEKYSKNIALSSTVPITPKMIEDLVNLTVKGVHLGIDLGYGVREATARAMTAIKAHPKYQQVINSGMPEKDFAKSVNAEFSKAKSDYVAPVADEETTTESNKETVDNTEKETNTSSENTSQSNKESDTEAKTETEKSEEKPDIGSGKTKVMKHFDRMTKNPEYKELVAAIDKKGMFQDETNIKKTEQYTDSVVKEYNDQDLLPDLAIELLNNDKMFHNEIQPVVMAKVADKLFSMSANEDLNSFERSELVNLAGKLATQANLTISNAAKVTSVSGRIVKSIFEDVSASEPQTKSVATQKVKEVQDQMLTKKEKTALENSDKDINDALQSEEFKQEVEKAEDEKIKNMRDKLMGEEKSTKFANLIKSLKINLKDC